MVITDSGGRNLGFFIDYFERHTISTEDFNPSADPSLTASKIGTYMDKGFLVRPNADGDFYGITLYAYERNNKSLVGLIPEPFDGLANEWIECRFVKVYSTTDGTYGSSATAVTIGVTI